MIKKTRINILQKLFSQKKQLKICFLFNTKEVFDDINDKSKKTIIKYDKIKSDENFIKEINKINSNFFNIKASKFPFDDILLIIKSSISGYY